MTCSITHKICFDNQEMAEEALIQNHGRHHYARGQGPVNFYRCDHCGTFHFTSKGPAHPKLSDPEVQKRIKLEREANDWSSRLR
ncbi:MAG: hypothetical protein KI790_00955 [Cyclobacteriaceae bacterium]|nr:hypothetical protein [Cyclobacteriaceae bacterium HetDA_MAG_MS6]